MGIIVGMGNDIIWFGHTTFGQLAELAESSDSQRAMNDALSLLSLANQKVMDGCGKMIRYAVANLMAGGGEEDAPTPGSEAALKELRDGDWPSMTVRVMQNMKFDSAVFLSDYIKFANYSLNSEY